MKKLLLIMLVLLIPFTTAMDVDIKLYSNDDINVHANPNTNGTTNYYLDGVNYDDTITRLEKLENVDSDRGEDIRSIYKSFYDFARKVPKEISIDKIKGRDELRLRYALENFFVPRKELFNIISYQDSLIQDLNFRLSSLEEMNDPYELCKAKEKIAIKNNIDKIICNDKVYTYNGLEFIRVEVIE